MTAHELDRITWRTSSFSGPNGGCVAVGHDAAGVLVRDSKNTDGPVLAFEDGPWRAFLTTASARTRPAGGPARATTGIRRARCSRERST